MLAAPPSLASPVEYHGFLVPARGRASLPVWGVKGGLAVGLWPAAGPRGLLRVYAPFLGHEPDRMVNFIAVEPVAGGRRGFSELERSPADGAPGLIMWTGGVRAARKTPPPPWEPDRGAVTGRGRRAVLRVRVRVERFENGALPELELEFRTARPHEVVLRVFAAPGSAPLRACILTATMGNYARLRRLWLADGPVDARALWTGATADAGGFRPHCEWPRERLRRAGRDRIVTATPDEPDPSAAAYDPAVDPWWRWRGTPAAQSWRTADVPGLVARVNARDTYYGTAAPIPGGLAFENFELEAPFVAGQAFVFEVAPGVALAHPGRPGTVTGR